MDDKKKRFVIPEAELVNFTNNDIITLSGDVQGAYWGDDDNGEEAVRKAVENAEDRADLAEEDFAAFAGGPQDVVVSVSASGLDGASWLLIEVNEDKVGFEHISLE